MNDRAISGVLEKYDMEVMRTMKGRGTIVCQSQEGYRVLKEYKGRTDKLELLDKMQKSMEGSIRTDKLIRNKEGELFCKDTDGVVYILKEHIEGRECSYRSEEDIRQAFAVMAKLHLIMTRAGQQEGFEADFPACTQPVLAGNEQTYTGMQAYSELFKASQEQDRF